MFCPYVYLCSTCMPSMETRVVQSGTGITQGCRCCKWNAGSSGRTASALISRAISHFYYFCWEIVYKFYEQDVTQVSLKVWILLPKPPEHYTLRCESPPILVMRSYFWCNIAIFKYIFLYVCMLSLAPSLPPIPSVCLRMFGGCKPTEVAAGGCWKLNFGPLGE